MLVLTLLINAAQVGRLNRKSLKLLKVPQTPFCIYKQCQINCPQDLERYHNLTPVFFTENQSQFLIFFYFCVVCMNICLYVCASNAGRYAYACYTKQGTEEDTESNGTGFTGGYKLFCRT